MYSAMKLSNTLHALSGYVIQTILCIRSAWNSARDLPSKFIANIMEALAEYKELELVPSLYQLAVTGHCLPVLKGWITDELGDRVRPPLSFSFEALLILISEPQKMGHGRRDGLY